MYIRYYKILLEEEEEDIIKYTCACVCVVFYFISDLQVLNS